MFNNSDLIKQQNLEALATLGILNLNYSTGTIYLVKKLGEFNLNLTMPTLFKSLLATPEDLKLGNLILFSPPEEQEPILCVDYEVVVAESILKLSPATKLILDIRNEIAIVEKYYSYIKDYEAFLYLKTQESLLKKKSEPLDNISKGNNLDSIINSLNNIIDKNEN